MSVSQAGLRLLHIIRSADPSGGGPIEALKQLAAIHTAAGHEVHVVTMDDPQSKSASITGLPFTPLGPASLGYGYTARLDPWLRAHAHEFDAAIVHDLWQYGSLATMRALAGSKLPYFVYTHGMLDPWFKREYPAKHLKKWLYWPWAEYRVLKNARAVLFTCETERVLARQSFWLYRCNERVVRFGTPGSPHQETGGRLRLVQEFQRAFPATAGKRSLLFLGRVHEKKGIDLLLRAYARMLANGASAAHLVVAGPADSAYGVAMKQLAISLNLGDHITWTGMVTGDLKWGAVHAADAFVLPSHQENFGIAVAESLSCGVPALISRQVNIWPEVVRVGAGLVSADDEAGTFDLLSRWWHMPEAERLAMAAQARACFEQHFRIEDAAQSLLDTLSECGVTAAAVAALRAVGPAIPKPRQRKRQA